jgi:hypothetical protein
MRNVSVVVARLPRASFSRASTKQTEVVHVQGLLSVIFKKIFIAYSYKKTIID